MVFTTILGTIGFLPARRCPQNIIPVPDKGGGKSSLDVAHLCTYWQQTIIQPLTAEYYSHVSYYAHRIRRLNPMHARVTGTTGRVILDKLTIHHLLTFAPLFKNIRHVCLFLVDFDGQAIYPCLIIGVTLSTLRMSHDLPYDMHDTSASDHLPWENMVSVLHTTVLVRKLSFDLEITSEGAPPPDCEHNLLVLCHRLLCLEHLSGLPLPMDLPSYSTSQLPLLDPLN